MNICIYRPPLTLPRLEQFLQKQNIKTTTCNTFEQMLHQVKLRSYEVIIVACDVSRPDINFLIIRSLRSDGIDAPIICIINKYNPRVYRENLHIGADFCLVEPLDKMNLLSLVEAQAKRYRPIKPRKLTFADITLDIQAKTVTRNGKKINLKKKEIMLLEYLLLHPGQVLTRSQLIAQIWDQTTVPASNVVDVHISTLRKKLEDKCQSRIIWTVHGFGYKLECDESKSPPAMMLDTSSAQESVRQS